MRRLIISAPFGNYLRRPYATSTLGTFTRRPRGGVLWRAWRVLTTVRPWFRTGAWVNRLGLPNPGIAALPADCSDHIVSVHGFDKDDWDWLALHLEHAARPPLAVELNLSCPNVNHAPQADEVRAAVERLLGAGLTVIAKLPPVRWPDLATPLFDRGVRHFHCCNTIPTPAGGLSGKPLKPFSLWAVSQLRKRFGKAATLIGGGGVTTPADVKEYLDAGADHVAVGSALFNPLFLCRALPLLAKAAEEYAP